MTAFPRLSRTGIEYGDLNWSIYPGCLHKPQGICPVPNCWAEGMSKRKRQDFHRPHLVPELLLAPLSVKKPSTILVNFMGDLMGDWVDTDKVIESGWTEDGIWVTNLTLKDIVMRVIRRCSQHTFIFLTKNPEGLLVWSPFPDNCWVGFSACHREMLLAGCRLMEKVKARVKFVSIEPMLENAWCLPSTLTLAGISWVIIGAQTKPTKLPELEWVEAMVEVADIAGAKVFLKDNLYDLLMTAPAADHDLFWEDMSTLRQEYPTHQKVEVIH